MSTNTPIEWTDMTWNPVTGCDKISAGCKNCYAERLSSRLMAWKNPSYLNGFEVTTHPRMLPRPLTWRSPKLIFVNSMSDLFHEKVPLSFIRQVFDIMGQASQHRFQVLTKRADRLEHLARELEWHSNIWMGVSVEDDRVRGRIDALRRVPAAVRFLSLEPLIGPLPDLNLSGIHWVIVGGESGPGARPMQSEWVQDIRDQCLKASVPFFFKQWGGKNKKATGRTLDGRIHSDLPIGTPATFLRHEPAVQ